jgi:SNF2 family DNA or RNA helicase
VKNYGTIELTKDGKGWVLECEPHVSKQTRLRVTNNRETCRDLSWVLSRWPLEFKRDADRELLLRVAAEHAQEVDLLQALMDGVREPRKFDLAVPARDYQRVAADAWLTVRGLLLADELGVGKTCSAIAALTDPRTRPALVVTQAHLTRQWQEELRKFSPGLTTHIIKKGTPYDIGKSMQKGRHGSDSQELLPGVGTTPDVLITNYHKLAGWEDTLAGLVKSVVFDEGQELRGGPKGSSGPIKKNVAAAAIAEAADFRLATTATPIYNYGGEFYNLLSVLRPHELGTRAEFAEQWCDGRTDAKAKIKDPSAFGTYLREQGFMIRRTREDVGRELPELVKVPHHISADREPLNDVESSAAELARIILEKGNKAKGAVMQASEELSNLVRQATGIAKAPHVADFVRMLVEQGEPVVLYGWHRSVYDIWLERLKDLRPAMYTGSESATQKAKARDAFINGDTDILIMSLRSGSGLDGLQQRGSTVVFGELDWSFAVHHQASGRIHRDGQERPVVAYYLISDTGSDPIVADVLGVKRAQLEGVIEPNGALIETLETGDDRIKKLAEHYLGRRAA